MIGVSTSSLFFFSPPAHFLRALPSFAAPFLFAPSCPFFRRARVYRPTNFKAQLRCCQDPAWFLLFGSPSLPFLLMEFRSLHRPSDLFQFFVALDKQTDCRQSPRFSPMKGTTFFSPNEPSRLGDLSLFYFAHVCYESPTVCSDFTLTDIPLSVVAKAVVHFLGPLFPPFFFFLSMGPRTFRLVLRPP